MSILLTTTPPLPLGAHYAPLLCTNAQLSISQWHRCPRSWCFLYAGRYSFRHVGLLTLWTTLSTDLASSLLLPSAPGHALVPVTSLNPSARLASASCTPSSDHGFHSPVSLLSSSNTLTLPGSMSQSSHLCCYIFIPCQGNQWAWTCWIRWSVLRSAVELGRRCDTAGHTEWTPRGDAAWFPRRHTLAQRNSRAVQQGQRDPGRQRGSRRPWRGWVSCFHPE